MQALRKKKRSKHHLIKFLFFLYRHNFNFETKMRFCVKSYSLVSWRNFFASVRMCFVELLCDGSEIATILNQFNQSLERRINWSSLVYVHKKNFPSRNVMSWSWSDGKRNPTEKRVSPCSCRVMFCLLKPITWIFSTLLKLPNKTNGCSATGKVSSNILSLNAPCGSVLLFTPII